MTTTERLCWHWYCTWRERLVKAYAASGFDRECFCRLAAQAQAAYRYYHAQEKISHG